MSYIVDRRLNGKNKSTVNRSRFLRRYRQHIKKSVDQAVTNRSIKDIDKGEHVSIPTKDIAEPTFHHGKGGRRSIVHPGNKEFQQGDRIPRPQNGQGGGSGEGDASDSGEGIDDFVFQISQDEFLEFLFEDLALPNLVKRQLAGIDDFKMVRGGISSVGTPSNINLVRSMRQATGRRVALGAATRRKLKKAQEEYAVLLEQDTHGEHQPKLKELAHYIEKLKVKVHAIPFIDTFDLRYNYHLRQPNPVAKAVMFCLMDVSGSMNQSMKDMAKRFFILLYLFLKRNYEKIEVVFIRHHTSAKEVDENEFFYSRETGGTIVSSALKLMDKTIEDRYPANEWNIYGAQASDGDNWNDDSPICSSILRSKILPQCQYFSYIEITPRRHQALWYEYERICEETPEIFQIQQINDPSDIFPVFKKLFSKKAGQS